MLNFSATRIDRSVSRAVTSPQLIAAEGTALIADSTLPNGVKASTGAASEIFVGIAISQQRSLSVVSTVEEVVVNASGNFTLANASYSTSFERFAFVTAGVEGAAIDMTPAVPGSPTASEAELVSGLPKTYLTNVSNAGKTVRAYYRFSPTAAQAQMLQGDVLPGGDAGLLLNTVGVCVAGDIFTSEYDPSVNWAGATATLSLAANGLFTLGGSGTLLANYGVRVISAPTAANPYLGLSLMNG